MERVLITGGAGFIGSHVADCLLEAGYEVRAFDNLCRQVHPIQRAPEYLDDKVELVVGDLRDASAVGRALNGVDAVIHLGTAVGVGQSMYQLTHYTDVNDVGTAVLLEHLVEYPVERLVVASSMSIYGEGLYQNALGDVCDAGERPLEQLKRKQWDVCDGDGAPLTPVATPESKRPALSSLYALSTYDQECMCLMMGRAYGIPTTALRFFNVYGTRQALSNPYTGVLAIFASRPLNDKPPLVFEGGSQRRDFVSVYDVARACRLALEHNGAADNVFNIGSGRQRSIVEVGEHLADVMDKDIAPEIAGYYRTGDIGIVMRTSAKPARSSATSPEKISIRRSANLPSGSKDRPPRTEARMRAKNWLRADWPCSGQAIEVEQRTCEQQSSKHPKQWNLPNSTHHISNPSRYACVWKVPAYARRICPCGRAGPGSTTPARPGRRATRAGASSKPSAAGRPKSSQANGWPRLRSIPTPTAPLQR